MSSLKRRDFVELGVLGALGAVSWPRTALARSGGPSGVDRAITAGAGPNRNRSAREVADLVLLNGRVYTVDDAAPRAQAFAIKSGRFLAVGSDDDIRGLVGSGTEVIDANRMTVTPGFIDAHNHPFYAGTRHLLQVNCDLRSIAEIQSAVGERAANTPPGEWVRGFLYDDTKLREGRALNRRDLDEAVPGHPVVVVHRGGHTAVYNSMAFKLAGITVDTPDPEGGKFYREDGELTGKVAERARAALNRLIPNETTREQRAEGVGLISRLLTAAGLTSVHETGGGEDGFIAYQDAREAGELGIRMYYFPSGAGGLGNEGFFAALKQAGIRTGFGDEWLRIGAVKYGADGSASERTMAMRTPYVGRPDDYGILTMDQAEIHAAVEDAVQHGFQIGIHANGDRTIEMVLNAYERAQERWPQTDPRFRIEHCSLVDPDLLGRIKAIGAIPTPFYTYVHYHGNKWPEYGEEKMRWMFAHRSFLDHGIPVAGASDYPPGPFEPLMAIQSMVTRTDFQGREWGPNQRISVGEALRVCTIHGAHASFEEDLKGSITPGKLADFVLLEEDPHEAEPDRIKEIPIARTVVGGVTMHEG